LFSAENRGKAEPVHDLLTLFAGIKSFNLTDLDEVDGSFSRLPLLKWELLATNTRGSYQKKGVKTPWGQLSATGKFNCCTVELQQFIVSQQCAGQFSNAER